MKIYNEKTLAYFCRKATILKEGYLEKKKPDTENAFQRRYFILTGNILTYFDKKNDKEALGCVLLENHNIDLRDDCTFAIAFGSPENKIREYVLKASSPNMAEEWMHVLTKCDTENTRALLFWLESQRGLSSSSYPKNDPDSTAISPEADFPRTNPFVNHDSRHDEQTDHLKWLLQFDWQQLHQMARNHLINT
ncbi:hypothetical protein Ciccas_002127 [Cichlidogyrus casuarinus]|uniref:PH domain-containing protein n=1 Tax=Cichlidogyrus casuarinus TaxID=1844966 RepID=A0ABD2QI64_9PLAT